VNERCLEAELMPLRRLVEEGNYESRDLIIGPDPTHPTEQECYECELRTTTRSDSVVLVSLVKPPVPHMHTLTDCSILEGYGAPFYFNLRVSPEGNECYCCPTCLGIFEEGVAVYLAVKDAGTAAPTAQPPPSMEPTTQPTTASAPTTAAPTTTVSPGLVCP
jgi:hypothetical protein